ncbi:MAG: HypC/HybG/HupF family hydrogenase formation chaperone [Acidimicrobiales bacterium]
MCTSRLHRIVSVADDGTVDAADIDGSTHKLSLLAYEGDPPQAGDWVVAHSGYALGPADRAEAEAVVAEYRAAAAAQHSSSSPS